ncbi:MAG: SDR family oxidoreductase [Cyclobacteriaceae bacterium]|nr:SDR family oxidoreductase [Cyclobacteriaceae bacterium SS2]
MKIIVAGATGYLGSHIVKVLQHSDHVFQAIARNRTKLSKIGVDDDDIIIAEVTKPETLAGKLEGADLLISTVGITRQKDGLTYMDVDYQANLNLLNEARKAGIRKFIYVSAINGQSMRHLRIMAAKERFVDELKSSGMEYLVVRPNGFFSDMRDFLDMAKKGKVYLFGDGEYKLNPIHGKDLAAFMIENVDSPANDLEVGGPDVLTQNEIGELALKAFFMPVKIVYIPDWVRKMIITFLRTFTSSKFYGPYEFFLTMMAQDNIAPRNGVYRLKTFFAEEVDHMRK